MLTKTYSDGSTFGPKEFAVAMVLGAAIAAPLIYLQLKLDDRKTRRIMKKSGYPESYWKK
jgi:hypothetical protein